MKKLMITGALVTLALFESIAQAPKSPKATAEGKNVKISYSQPAKKGRVIFGELVPYSQVWRAGANEATEITLAKDAVISGKELKAGTYTLFVNPEKEKWTVILNSELKQWGAFGYDKIKDKDVLKIETPVKKVAEKEKLTYFFTDNAKGTDLSIGWDNVEVTIPIIFK